MKHDNIANSDHPDDVSALEMKLRSLPRPTVPSGLLDALLADIPEQLPVPPVVARALSATTRRFAIVAALAASLLIALGFFKRPTNTSIRRDTNVSADFVLSPSFDSRKQETDPCSVLPPLADVSHLFRQS
jgi:hypothetical protein